MHFAKIGSGYTSLCIVFCNWLFSFNDTAWVEQAFEER